ncbi:MAG: hypothetical protein V7L04_32185 [Nostoc sp.]|uniref:hypothetical protein n=1 Tax=Nostoc sp. TaxID=1180 RepID=UPI002FF6BB49
MIIGDIALEKKCKSTGDVYDGLRCCNSRSRIATACDAGMAEIAIQASAVV